MIQVDTMCHKIPNFVEKSRRAGVTRVFIGLENVNPDNLIAAKKRQNKITEYRRMLLDWKAQSIFVYAGYILGFPGDTPESIRRDISIIKRELPLDMLEFNILTPLPGSEDHKVLWGKGVDMDADLNKYDLEHAVTDHPKMTREELEAIYQEAWSIYYTPEHIETLLRRAVVTNIPLLSFMKVLVQFTTMMQVEKVHPLQSGLFRLKHIAERRPGLPAESTLAFYPRFVWTLIANNLKLISTIWWMLKLKRRIERDPDRHRYMDQALTPVRDDDEQTLDLLTKTDGGRAAVAHQKNRGAHPRRGRVTPRDLRVVGCRPPREDDRSRHQSCLSRASPPDTSTLPGASSTLSFFTTPSSTSMALALRTRAQAVARTVEGEVDGLGEFTVAVGQEFDLVGGGRFFQASMTKMSLTDVTAMVLTPLALIASAFCVIEGTCILWQVPVNAPGTANSATFLPLKMSSVVFHPGPSAVITRNFASGNRSPTLMGMISSSRLRLNVCFKPVRGAGSPGAWHTGTKLPRPAN